jgi:methyltransferase (TIGR00027 family)
MEEMGLPDTPAESSTIAPRTRLVDDLVVEATDVGVGQIVLVAAGMDTRVFRLPLPSDPVVFEFDNLPVLEEEQSVVDNEPAVPICRRIAVPMDLAEVAWSTAVTEAGFDISKPTIFIVEGPPGTSQRTRNARLLDHLANLAAPASRLDIDMVNHDYLENPAAAPFFELTATRVGSAQCVRLSRPWCTRLSAHWKACWPLQGSRWPS